MNQMAHLKNLTVFAALVGLVTFLIYMPALGNGFVDWDDRYYVLENAGIRSIDLRSLYWMFFEYYAANWHPLTWLSLAVDYSFWGLNPKGYHLTNIVLHTINTMLVVVLSNKLFLLVKKRPGSALQFAALVGLLFGLHPIHAESVAWVSERKDVLYCLFYLSSIIFYLNYQATQRKLNYGLCLLTFILSVLAKPMAISLPFVLVVLDYYPLGKLQINGPSIVNSIRSKLPLFGIALALAALTFYVQRESGAMGVMQVVGMDERLLLAQRALVFYLYKTIVPVGYIYLYLMPSSVTLLNPLFYIPLVVNTAAVIVVYKLRNKIPLLTAAVLVYLVTLLPVIGVVQVGGQAAADRYMYFTVLVPIILVVSGVMYVQEKMLNNMRGKSVLYVALLAVISFLAYLTVVQVAVWKDTISLTTHAVKHDPQNNHAYTKRADVYYQRGMYREVIDDMTKVIEIGTENPTRAANPQDWDYAFRGESYLRVAMYPEAINDYSVAIAINDTVPSYFLNRAKAYEAIDQPRLALSDYLRSIDLTPGDVMLRNKIALIQFELGMYADAIEQLSAAIQLRPGQGALYFSRALNYNKLGNQVMAESDLQKATDFGVLGARARFESLKRK